MDKEDKIIIAVASALLTLILVFPIKQIYKDGGSVVYMAIGWSYTDWCRQAETGRNGKPDAELRILFFNFVID